MIRTWSRGKNWGAYFEFGFEHREGGDKRTAPEPSRRGKRRASGKSRSSPPGTAARRRSRDNGVIGLKHGKRRGTLEEKSQSVATLLHDLGGTTREREGAMKSALWSGNSKKRKKTEE